MTTIKKKELIEELKNSSITGCSRTKDSVETYIKLPICKFIKVTSWDKLLEIVNNKENVMIDYILNFELKYTWCGRPYLKNSFTTITQRDFLNKGSYFVYYRDYKYITIEQEKRLK